MTLAASHTLCTSLSGRVFPAFSNSRRREAYLSSVRSHSRQQAAQYNPHQNADTLKLQLAIKSASGVVIDEQALARETAM